MIILAAYIGLAVLLIAIIPKNTPAPIIAGVGLLFPFLVIMTCLFFVRIYDKIKDAGNSRTQETKESWGRFAFFAAVIVFSLLVLLF